MVLTEFFDDLIEIFSLYRCGSYFYAAKCCCYSLKKPKYFLNSGTVLTFGEKFF